MHDLHTTLCPAGFTAPLWSGPVAVDAAWTGVFWLDPAGVLRYAAADENRVVTGGGVAVSGAPAQARSARARLAAHGGGDGDPAGEVPAPGDPVLLSSDLQVAYWRPHARTVAPEHCLAAAGVLDWSDSFGEVDWWILDDPDEAAVVRCCHHLLATYLSD